jgi:hypothetical protein
VLLHIGERQLRASVQPARAWPWRKAVVASEEHVFAADLTPPYAAAIAATLEELQACGDLRESSLHVTVANVHVHFDVVAGDYATYSDAQLRAIAQSCVFELLGNAAAHQTVRCHLQPDLRHLFLCAMDRQLVDDVVQAAQQQTMKLASLQPAFCHHWNHHASTLESGNGVFTVLDSGRILIACALRGSIMALSYGAWNLPAIASADATQGGRMLDQRVDRLLASFGQPARQMLDFVLLSGEPLTWTPSARWRLCVKPEEIP